MIDGLAILIVEDDPFVAYDLAFAIEDAGGLPVGPAGTVAEAHTLLDQTDVAAAIMDADLGDDDATQLGLRLLDARVSLVVLVAVDRPAGLAARKKDFTVVVKPTQPATVLRALLERIAHNRAP